MFFGSVGVLRFPDVYTRLHAAGKCDTGGAMSILVAIALSVDASLMIKAKFLILGLLIALVNPMVSHALARGIYKCGVKPHGELDFYARDNT